MVFIAGQAAEQDGAADYNDGGSPAKTICPSVVIVAFEDLFVEFHWINDQSNDLEYR